VVLHLLFLHTRRSNSIFVDRMEISPEVRNDSMVAQRICTSCSEWTFGHYVVVPLTTTERIGWTIQKNDHWYSDGQNPAMLFRDLYVIGNSMMTMTMMTVEGCLSCSIDVH
jgi:hypothetical protein